MNVKLVTTYNNKLYKKYAKRFFDTYNWPFKVLSYNEDVDLFYKIPDCKAFVERNKNRPVTGFKMDGVRFCYKVYAYTHAIMFEDVDGLICIDADSVFYKPIDEKFIKKNIHRDNCMMSYLGRSHVYSECGFLYFNLNHKYIRKYAETMKKMYDEDIIYALREYHDSYVWDYVRIQFEKRFGIKNHNITEKESSGHKIYDHIQAFSCLAPYYDHCKGDRKDIGRSPENRQL